MGWAALAVLGAFCLGTVALRRGEHINALWIVTAAVSIDHGKLLSVDSYPVVGQPGRWRMIVDSVHTDQPANLRATLERGDTALSETLINQFY